MPLTLPKRKMCRYCLADIAKGLFNGMIGNYLIYFFQPTAASGLPSLLPQNKLFGYITIMALLTGIGKIIDAITDPLVASLSDKCTHKDGRRMVFMRYAAIHGANEHIKIQNIGLSGCICCAMRPPSVAWIPGILEARP